MNVVRIKRIRVNFQIRFGYVPTLNDYIKTIPREQCQTKMQPILQPDGTTKEDWFRICNPIGLVKIIWFCWDNGFKIEYDNIKESDIARIEEFATNRRTTLEKVEDFKKNGVDISNVDYSFMKIQPYAYQKEAVHFFEITNGRALLGDSPGVGKAQKLDALIATPDGWTRMGDLKIGQKVFHHNGDSYPITGIFPQGLIKSYKVIFNDGFSTECSLDHLWLVRDANRRRRGKGWVVKSLGELINSKLTYRFHQGRADSGRKQPLKWEIPIVEPIQYPEQNFIIPPYILGALIGDGYICGKTVTISIPDFQLNTLDKINSLLPTNLKTIGNRYSQCPQYNITQSFGNKILRNPYKIEINKLGLNVKSGQKFIPSIYLKGNINQRLDLLRGLMDTDGSADRNRINFHTTSKQLALDVSELVQSLGGQAILKIYDRSKENKPTEYRVNVRIKICPFYLPDKIKQWWPAKRNYPSRYIESVEEVDCFEQQCISVSSPDNTYITNNYIVTHNTLSATAYATKNKLKTLVICPASLKLNWRKEILKFTYEKAFIFKYKPKKKENIINYSTEESLFHIINYESLETYLKFDVHHKCENQFCDFDETSKIKKYKACPKCFKEKSVKSRNTEICKLSDKDGVELNIQDYDLVVIDESHYLKEIKTNRTKIVKNACKSIPKKILLSGTAIKNRPMEFFSLLNFLDEHEWVNAHNFGVRYCDGFVDKFDHWHYDGHSNLEELYDRISYLFLRRLKKDVLKHLPPKTYTIIPIELSTEEQREYNKLEKGILDETDQMDDSMTHLARIQILKQFTSKINAKNAIDFIKNIIDGDEKIVIFTQFLSTADFLYETFKECAVLFTGRNSMSEKNQAVEMFMEDEKCKVFVGTIGAAGVGITLTSASMCLFVDRPWSPGDETQGEDRIHRANTTAENIQILKMICQNTIDVDIDKLLAEKNEIVSKVLDGEYVANKKEFSIFNDLVKILLNKKYG